MNRKWLIYTFLTLLLFNQYDSVDGELATALMVASIAKKIIMTVAVLWTVAEKTELSNKIDTPLLKNNDKKILQGLADISNDIKNLEVMIIQTTQAIQDLKGFIDRNSKFNQLETLMLQIDIFYKTYESYVNRSEALEKETLEKFAYNVIDDSSNSVKGYFQQIHGILFDRGLLKQLTEDLKNNDGSCSTNRSPQQILFQIYNTVLLMEIKSQVMMQFSYIILKSHGKGNYTVESEILRNQFESRISKSQTLLKHSFENINRDLWHCDPQVHKEDVTYLQLTRMLQGVVEHEVNLNDDESCTENCGYYEHAHSSKHKYNCAGSYYSCRFVESHMNIYPASRNSTRRYEYIDYDDGPRLGKKPDNIASIREAPKRFESWHYWFWHCSACLCICDQEDKRSDRYFNLRTVTSDIENNRVVTGVKFVRKNRIIHLQIQEGRLLQQGQINASTTNWVPVSDFTILDKGVKNGVDYHTMNWQARHFDLDDLKAPKDHVVTGVKFRMIGKHMNLQIRVTQIDFESGRIVDPHLSYWIGNDHTNSIYDNDRRDEIGLYLPDIPTRTPGSSPQASHHNSYIKFTFSDMYKDASQTTVPFIDAQDVANDPPVPLEGLGMILKARNGYGGFVTPKITTFNYSPYV